MQNFKSNLHEMSKTTATSFWNDSCSISEIEDAISHGAVGATTNPVIVGQVLKAELDKYKPVVKLLIDQNPYATEDDIAWLLNERMAVDGSNLLKPIYEASGKTEGFISIQTNTKYYKNKEQIVKQAEHFSKLTSNIMVKMPVTQAGVQAVEECTYRGINVNATVSFTVPQAVAVAEAVERGLKRREKEGKDNTHLHPVCTLMVGRMDDWLKDVANRDNIIVDPEALEYAGVAVFKRAYEIYQSRKYKTKLLSAAYRNHYHWSAFVGGDVVLTIPYKWICRFIDSGMPCLDRINQPVPEHIITQLEDKFVDFRKAYTIDGLAEAEFDSFGATKKTLLQFLQGYDEMVGIVRKIMLDK